MKFSEILKEFIDLRVEEMHPQFNHSMSFNMMEQRRQRIEFLENELNKKVLDTEEEV
jgi:hypothetical protein